MGPLSRAFILTLYYYCLPMGAYAYWPLVHYDFSLSTHKSSGAQIFPKGASTFLLQALKFQPL